MANPGAALQTLSLVFFIIDVSDGHPKFVDNTKKEFYHEVCFGISGVVELAGGGFATNGASPSSLKKSIAVKSYHWFRSYAVL